MYLTKYSTNLHPCITAVTAALLSPVSDASFVPCDTSSCMQAVVACRTSLDRTREYLHTRTRLLVAAVAMSQHYGPRRMSANEIMERNFCSKQERFIRNLKLSKTCSIEFKATLSLQHPPQIFKVQAPLRAAAADLHCCTIPARAVFCCKRPPCTSVIRSLPVFCLPLLLQHASRRFYVSLIASFSHELFPS